MASVSNYIAYETRAHNRTAAYYLTGTYQTWGYDNLVGRGTTSLGAISDGYKFGVTVGQGQLFPTGQAQ